ncbi:hypothetical protein FB639_004604, partial [Coemansia asiatica]
NITVLGHGIAEYDDDSLQDFESDQVITRTDIDRYSTGLDDERIIDPFEVRARPEFEKIIVKDMLAIAKNARTEALLRIEKTNLSF